MTDDTPMPDYQNDPSSNNPLWHNEFMDLRDLENFDAMEATYFNLQTQVTSLGENGENAAVIIDDMKNMYPQYIQAHNYHHNPTEYHPELIPPTMQRQSATPPGADTPAPENRWVAAAAAQPGFLAVPATSSHPSAAREPRREGSRPSAVRSDPDAPRKRRKR